MSNGLERRLRGDFGRSFQNRVDVGPEILKRLPVTLELAVLRLSRCQPHRRALGAISAFRHTKRADSVITTLATVLGAIPNFWLATLLVLVFAVKLRILPAGGFTPFLVNPLKNLQQMILPAISLGVVSSALLLRIMRASMIEVLSSEYIRTARAKGASEATVLRRHALRNATIPYLTVGAVEFGFLFGGVVIIEDIFRLPGIGSFVLVGIINRDYPVLLGAALVVTIFVLTANMLVDIVGSLLDPRQVRSKSGSRMSGVETVRSAEPRPHAATEHLVLGGVLVLLITIAGVFAPWIAPYSPYDLDVANMLKAPSWSPLARNRRGRTRCPVANDLCRAHFGRPWRSWRWAWALSWEPLIGVLSAYFGGITDLALMRLMELLFSFPAILLAVILMASLGTSTLNAMLAIGIIFIPGFARLARASTMAVLRQSYIDAAQDHRHERSAHYLSRDPAQHPRSFDRRGGGRLRLCDFA